MELSLVVIVAIVNHLVLGILIDDESSCDIIYTDVFVKLWLHDQDLIPYERRKLLTFNNSITRPTEIVKLPIYVEEGKDERTLNACFLVIPCRRVYNYILGRSFLTMLDVMAYVVHLKMKYHPHLRKEKEEYTYVLCYCNQPRRTRR